VDAADPARLVRAAMADIDPHTLSGAIVAAGKAAWSMYRAAAPSIVGAAAVIAAPTPGGDSGEVAPSMVALPGVGAGPGVEAFLAGHPAPNAASVAAGARALALARSQAGSGRLLELLSGGASALQAAPVDGVTLEDKIETGRAQMAAGAAIHELNCVRKHLSRIKGGRLAAAAGRSLTLALSDVHGPVPDDPSVIGSGPTVPDDTTFRDACDVLRARGVRAPATVMAYLERGVRGDVEESVKPGDPRLSDAGYVVIGNRTTAVEGAQRAAAARGYRVLTIAAATEGEARDAGQAFVHEARRMIAGAGRPLCVIGSGEPTVTVRGPGLGGRNQEFALSAAAALEAGGGDTVLGSAGTDGIDGPTDAAGAMVDPSTLVRARSLGLDPHRALADNDAYPFLAATGDLILWGPTGTNVGDLHVMLFA
jgi:hydroxypyruvate reductase